MSLVKVSQQQGRVPVTVFHLQERVNLGNSTELEQAAREAHQKGMRNLLIDLSSAPSLTSAGLRAIMMILKMLGADGASQPESKSAHLKLVSPTSYVKEVLDVAGLADYIEIYDSLPEAVASF